MSTRAMRLRPDAVTDSAAGAEAQDAGSRT
jgi:hypothetical protein